VGWSMEGIAGESSGEGAPQGSAHPVRRRLFQGGGLLADLRSDRAKLDAERQRTYEDPAEHDARTCILAWWSAGVARPRDGPPIKKTGPSGKAEAS
jgi:hypothetical protein